MTLAANNSARRHQRVCAERFIKSKNPRDFVFCRRRAWAGFVGGENCARTECDGVSGCRGRVWQASAAVLLCCLVQEG